jgi:predicted regulator of amino acid metabolism with ACT domain
VVKVEVKIVIELSNEELEQKILKYLSTVNMAKNRNVAKAIGLDKKLVDKAISKLAKEDKLEYVYLGTSFVKLKGK